MAWAQHETAELLLDHGADVNTEKAGQAPLYRAFEYALASGDHELSTLLADHGGYDRIVRVDLLRESSGMP